MTARHPIEGNPLDAAPEAWAAFEHLYGTIWSRGTVDQPTKEVARLRNARRTPCNLCKSLRFAGAREQGLTEERVALIEDGYADSELSDREKAAIRLVDVMLDDPHGMDDGTRAALREHFDDGQLVELALAISLFHGFSKIAVALGPPEEIPTMVVPTPDVAEATA